MKISFSKYQGTGNDFILIDDRNKKYSGLTTAQIERLCHRNFGIGADGLILLQQNPGVDFYMKYYNSDGNESTMCGNGGRCIAAYAKSLNIVKDNARFMAIDGAHEAIISSDASMIVKLKMSDVKGYEMINEDVYLNTGSPHYVRFVNKVISTEVEFEGQKIRYNDRFREEGTNVNFVEVLENILIVRSYEREVEGETYSCGTGVVASVLASVIKNVSPEKGKKAVHTNGGILNVYYEQKGAGFQNVWLEGEATFVYKGEIEI